MLDEGGEDRRLRALPNVNGMAAPGWLADYG
jgi:hypothetical protein